MSDAAAFRVLTKDQRKLLYTCEIEHDDPFVADLNFVVTAKLLAPIKDQLTFLESNAQKYWSGVLTDNPIREILAPAGTVKIATSAGW
jgi:hypothetical protein